MYINAQINEMKKWPLPQKQNVQLIIYGTYEWNDDDLFWVILLWPWNAVQMGEYPLYIL